MMSHQWWFAVGVGTDRPGHGARERVEATDPTSRRCRRRTRRIRATSGACGWFAPANRRVPTSTSSDGWWAVPMY